MKKIKTLMLLALLGLVGCGGEQAVQPTSPTTGDQPSAAQSRGAEPRSVTPGQSADGKLPAKRTVYFAFDSNVVDAANRAIVEENAAYLSANPQAKATLEGHTDERGTREYNLALGERRAQSVERMLRVLGISGNRVSAMSYGEEKPAAMAHDESAWRLNRRVEFIYK